MSISIEVTAHVVAAGIFGSKTRVTVVFTPVIAKAETGKYLENWPEVIDGLLEKKGADGKPQPIAALLLQPLQSGESWRNTTFAAKPQPLKLTRIGTSKDSAAIGAYWRDIMGVAKGFESLKKALSPTAADPLDDMMRPSETEGIAEDTPDIHGTGRSKVVAEHSFERVRAFIQRLNKSVVGTREVAKAGDALSAKVAAWAENNPRPLVSDKASPWNEAKSAAEDEDKTAWDDLANSRQRADHFAKARRIFSDLNSSSEAAIKALTDALQKLATRTVSMVALDAATAKTVSGIEFAEASAAYRLASRTPTGADDTVRTLSAEEFEIEYARRRLFTIQSNPSLGRLFRFVVDFTCPTGELETLAQMGKPYEDGMVLDFDASDKDLINEEVKLDAAVSQSAYFMLLSLSDTFEERRILSTAKCRLRGQSVGHFYPCTREEIDARVMGKSSVAFREAAVAEQIDGLVDLGQKIELGGQVERRYDIMTLDPVTATGAEYNRKYSRAEIQQALDDQGGKLPPKIKGELSQLNAPQNATQRGGGLALGDRWRQWHNILRHIDSAYQRDAYAVSDGRVILDASDLATGYKLDVGLRLKKDSVDRSRWHTLMHRYVAYEPMNNTKLSFAPSGLNQFLTDLYPDAAARREADDGQVQLPTAMRDWTEEPSKPIQIAENSRNYISGFAEEIVGAWQGDPLGLSAGREKQTLDPDKALRVNMTYTLPTLKDPALTPPRLRFGWRYRFGLRAVFTGGVSMPLNRAFGHYEKQFGGDLISPAAQKQGHAYRRHERIDAAAITVPDWLFGTLAKNQVYTKVQLQGRFAVPQTGRMVIRSFDDPGNRDLAQVPKEASKQEATPSVGFDRRILVAPAVSLDFATLHDAFRNKKNSSDFDLNVKMCEPRVRDEEAPEDTNERLNEELTPKPEGGEGRQVWSLTNVYWRSFTILSRPKGGLRNVDYRAAWGGFSIYRAALSSGAVEPKWPIDDNSPEEVRSTPPPITDEGQILHRTKSAGFKVFADIPSKARSVYFAAVGVLRGEKGLSERSGTAVFRPLAADRENDLERLPYYPDPAATSMMISVAVRGDPGAPVKREIKLYDDTALTGPAADDYPHARPVVIDIVRGDRKKMPIAVKAKISYANLPHTPSAHKGPKPITVAHVIVTLSPGEEADIRCWCVPSITYLAYMSALMETLEITAVAHAHKEKKYLSDVNAAFVEGLVDLIPSFKGQIAADAADLKIGLKPTLTGLGGLPTPGNEVSLKAAKLIRDALLVAPIPEIAAVTEIEAVHAVDIPQEDAKGIQAGLPWALLRATPDQIVKILKKDPAPQDPHKELHEPATWTLQNQMSGAIDVLIDGSIAIHGPSTGAIEIRASGAAAARGRFDDAARGRSRDDQARGLWPKPDGISFLNPTRLFGFELNPVGSVTFDQETVTLLRIEGFPPETRRIDLLDQQRNADELNTPNADGGNSPLRAQRPAAFPDACARYIRLFAVAISRHVGSLRTRYDELPETLNRITPEQVDGKPTGKPMALKEFWLPATVRPPRAVPKSALPSFVWEDHTLVVSNGDVGSETKVPLVYTKRSSRVRVRLKRPWFVTGEGERLGVVIWPPNLFTLDSDNVRNDRIKPPPADRQEIDLRKLPDDGSGIPYLQDADLGMGGQWVTRWASDPIRSLGQVDGWLLSKDNLPHEEIKDTKSYFEQPPEMISPDALLVINVLMPVPVDADARPTDDAKSAGGFMAVSLVTFAPRFDPEQEDWYADVDINPCGAIYPFVRLGLVRYQPNAPRALQVSEPVVEWMQIMPERKVSAKATRKKIDGVDKVLITATVEGAFSQPDPKGSNTNESTERAPVMRLALLRREAPLEGELLGSEVKFGAEQSPYATCSSECMAWSATFVVPLVDYGRKGERWTVYAEEVDRLRPASYIDEPRYGTRSDNAFAETGPRFTARLPLESLEVVKG
ncbi:hypothetical protein [Mesorhizobium sp.]|uniref:hypothetical protein n=1 Tax=Mesorhizobium sp. TaxID=1871066 RepID=UPI000FE875B3|nr:hypothetical protein [Mesorhizobium sp.]RWP58626.1 MAG: hypothetical protein EOR08_26665 [Mesorhizobium sp.]